MWRVPVAAAEGWWAGEGGRAGRGPTVDNAVDAALLEGHDVLCERSRLVGEDVLHLAQQVVEAGASRFGGQVLGLVVHTLIPVDEDAVSQVDELGPADASADARARGVTDQPAGRLALPPLPPGSAEGGARRPRGSQDEHGHGHHDAEQDEEAPEDEEGLGGLAAHVLGRHVVVLGLELPHLVPEAQGQDRGDYHHGQKDLRGGWGGALGRSVRGPGRQRDTPGTRPRGHARAQCERTSTERGCPPAGLRGCYYLNYYFDNF